MTIQLDPELVARLSEVARNQGRSVEDVALEGLRSQFLDPKPTLDPPRDEWERRLRSLASDYGVSLSDEALGREAIYDE